MAPTATDDRLSLDPAALASAAERFERVQRTWEAQQRKDREAYNRWATLKAHAIAACIAKTSVDAQPGCAALDGALGSEERMSHERRSRARARTVHR